MTDAGTPGISDPGPALVALAREAGFAVVPLPGPSAVATALSASGLPADRYLFLGFPPRKGEERRAFLRRAAREPWSVVFFEAANRLEELLVDLSAAAGAGRRVVVARELTKIHEEFRAGTLEALASYYRENAPRGEVTLVLEGWTEAPPDLDPETLRARAQTLLGSGMKPRDVVRALVDESGAARNRVYEIVVGLGREGEG